MMSRRMKKWANATLIAVVTLASLSACGGGNDEGKRDDPAYANCIAQGHNADHCASKFRER